LLLLALVALALSAAEFHLGGCGSTLGFFDG